MFPLKKFEGYMIRLLPPLANKAERQVTADIIAWNENRKLFFEGVTAANPSDKLQKEPTHVCADCGTETYMENGPCFECKGFRIVAISFAEQHFGKNWKSAFIDP